MDKAKAIRYASIIEIIIYVCIGTYIITNTAKKYLQLSRDQIEKLTPDQCSEAALLLSSLAFHIQRSYNREIARINWADRTLKTTLAGREQAYKGSWESQFNQAVDTQLSILT